MNKEQKIEFLKANEPLFERRETKYMSPSFVNKIYDLYLEKSQTKTKPKSK